MQNRRKFLLSTATLAAAPGLLVRGSAAENWPVREVRFVVGFEPGGATDTIARVMAGRLKEVWGQPVAIENVPGAGGNKAAELVAKAEPDGYTILMASLGQATNKFLYPSLGYDPVKDFAPVTQLVMQPNVMAVPVASPETTVAEFIAECKANPGQVTYASAGNGSSLHLCGELFKRIAGVDMKHVPYRGSAPALQDLLIGKVDVIFDNVTSILPHVMAGGARGLAVTTAKRIAAAPDLPTLIESGLPGFDVASWFALFVPVKTSKAVVAKIHDDAVAALEHANVKQRLLQLGCEIVGSTPQELAKLLQSEMDGWGPLIRQAGIKLDN